MRDLKADLEYCKKAHFDGRWLHTPMDFIDKAYKGWPHAIERAIKAEAIARELVGVIDELRRQINECGLDNEMWEVYERAKEVLGDD